MKRAGDRYPHKPSPGHTLDEVLKSLRDLIRNDLAAPNVVPGATPDAHPEVESQSAADTPPNDVAIPNTNPETNPDPSAHEIVDEVVAGLERELAELDDIEAHDDAAAFEASPASDDVPDAEAAPEDVEFLADAEVEEILIESPVEEETNVDTAEPDVALVYPNTSPEMFTDATPSEPALEPAPEPTGPIETCEADVADLSAESDFGPDVDANMDSVDLDSMDMDPDPATHALPESPPTGVRERPAERLGERLRESLALIAPDNADAIATPAQPMPKPAPPINAPLPEADAIPVLDEALDSQLPLDFHVRCRAIAIQATARFDRDMRREGRAPLSSDLVAHLARILEQALAQEFPERAPPEDPNDP